MERASAVVIGGGIIGACVTYHLARRGWRNVQLLEKSVLTAGSTWHAAANGNSVNPRPNISRLQRRSIELYREIEEETGQSLSIHRPGGIFLATNADRLSEYKTLLSRGRRLDFGWRLIGPQEIAERHPLTNVEGVLGGLYGEDDGHIDPSGATHAFAMAARARGARVRQNTAVQALVEQADGTFVVVTEEGEIAADYIVNAAGLWADEVAAMAGQALPMTKMEHHYLITEPIPEVAGAGHELPLIRDGDASFYMRQEQAGLLLGVYEAEATPWAVDGVPKEFGQELLPDALDRLMPNLEQAFERFPVLAQTGIRRAVNGPFVFSPDGNPLIGPMPNQPRHFAAAAFLAGLNMGAGFGEAIAEWMDTGRTRLDLSSCDVARFGAFAPGRYALERAKDTYAHRYQLHYPHEERAAGRPVRAFPLAPWHLSHGAVMGPVNGWERPLWYARASDEARDIYGFGRQNWHASVCAEVKAVRSGVGIMDASAFAKYEVSGPGAHEWLDAMVANTLPADGRIRLAHMCDHEGGIVAEFTVTRLGEGRFLLIGASAAEAIHLRHMRAHLSGDVEVRAITAERGVIAVQGPSSRTLLSRLTNADLSNEAFPYLSSQAISVAGRPCLALRVSFVGELGWELYCAVEDLAALWETIMDAGEDLGVTPFGARALDMMRLEKGYARYASEISIEVSPYELNLGALVKLDKGAFLGREALAERRQHPRARLQLLQLPAASVDPIGQETVVRSCGAVAGYVTSGAFSPAAGTPLALALLRPETVDEPEFAIDLMTNLERAIPLNAAPHDPKGTRLRT